jgi:hypothetical protein
MSLFGIQGLVLLAIFVILALKIARRWAADKSKTILPFPGSISSRNAFCTNCGAAQQPDGRFCGACGARRGE